MGTTLPLDAAGAFLVLLRGAPFGLAASSPEVDGPAGVLSASLSTATGRACPERRVARVAAADGGDAAPEPARAAGALSLGRGRGGDAVGDEMVLRGSGDSLQRSGCFAGAADGGLALLGGRPWAALAGRDDSGGRRDDGRCGLAGRRGSGRCGLLSF